jgi:Cu+-exporting ATPase
VVISIECICYFHNIEVFMAVKTVQMKVSGLMCSFCTMSVEKALKRYPGVKSVMVNLVHGIVLVEADTAEISQPELAEAVEKLGYSVSSTESQQIATDEALFDLIKERSTIGMIIAVLVVLLDSLNIFGLPAWREYISFAAAAFILLWVGQPILKKTILAMRQRVINANVLLSVGAWGSFIVGTMSLFDDRWPNFLPVAAWLMSLHLFFGYFKLDTRRRASEAVRKLMNLQPPKARVLRGPNEVEVLTHEVSIGETVVVRPGERIPLDGNVFEGSANVDQSSFTGESVPAEKTEGSDVIGGTLNLDGQLKVRVTKTGSDSFISQIVKLMSQISERKPPLELLADRLMNYYGPVVFIVAAISFVAWILFTGNIVNSTLVLLTVVIMGYPCALGITTPMLAAIAGGKGISIGLLVKASEVFHELSIVDTVVFDKTGTLTYGKPTVTDIVPIGLDQADFLSFAGAVEAPSEHPLGQAIAFYAQKEGANKLEARNFKALIGKGVEGQVNDEEVIAGKPSFLEERGIRLGEGPAIHLKRLSGQGKTVVMFAKNGQLIGLAALQDTPRPSSFSTINKLKAKNIKTVMLTGDALPVAQAIGRQLGIDDVKAELMPTQKVEAIEALQREGAKVAMVGDGINDAPALAQANVGIAIGAGTDVAIESAGVILVGDRLDDVAGALTLGKASYRTMTGNVIVAVLFNVVGMILAALGFITPLFAIVFMIVSIFAILLNTLRIQGLKLGREAETTREHVQLAQVEYLVPKMVCEGCAETIRNTLKPVAGIQEVRPKVVQKHVIINYEPSKIQESEIRRKLEDAGYSVLEA